MRATAIFPFAASRILFNEGKGERRRRRRSFSADLVPFSPWPRPGKISARGEKELRKRGVDALEIRRESTQSLSLLLLSFSSSPRIEGCTLRCVFQLLGSSNLRGGGRGRLHHAPTESRVFLGHEAADVSCEGREGREREIVEGPARDFDRPLGYLRDFSPARYVILFKIFSPFLFSPPPPRVEFDRVFFTSLVPRSTFRRH